MNLKLILNLILVKKEFLIDLMNVYQLLMGKIIDIHLESDMVGVDTEAKSIKLKPKS